MSARTALPNTPSSVRTSLPKSVSGGTPTSQAQSLKELGGEFKKFLYENPNPQLANAFQNFEQKTGAKREHVAYGVLVVLSLYLIVGHSAELVVNLIGVAYPAYASVKAIRTEDKSDDTLWLTYWAVFGFSSVLDFWVDSIMHVFPLYLLLKSIALLYLSLPQTRGAQQLYVKVVDPAISRIEARLGAKSQ